MSDGDAPTPWGRVDPDGTVYVRTAEGERTVGQVPDVPEAEALAFFTRRYDALELEVSLLERRLRSGALAPDDAAGAIKTVRKAVTGANAVGDLAGLLARLQALQPVVDEARASARAERTRHLEEVRAAKEKAVAEAEALVAEELPDAEPLADPDALTLDDGTGPQTMDEQVDETDDGEDEE